MKSETVWNIIFVKIYPTTKYKPNKDYLISYVNNEIISSHF